MLIFAREFAGVAQLVEHNLAKVRVAGSSPVSRSDYKKVSSKRRLFFFSLLSLSFAPPKVSNQRKRVRK